MARHGKDLGARKSVRIQIQSQGYLIPAPDAPWIECTIVDVSDGGVCLMVGDLAVPKHRQATATFDHVGVRHDPSVSAHEEASAGRGNVG